MKKALSILTAAAIMVCTLAMSFTAFAATPSIETVDAQLEGGTNYIMPSPSFSVSSATDFVTYLRAGMPVSEQMKKDYVDSVYDNLATNGGKIVVGSEDLGYYGSNIIALKELGYDVESFGGYDNQTPYNIVDAFEALPANQISNPYYYRLAIEAADDTFAHTLCDQLIADYYTLGSGMNYWGYSCDNTATFLTAIAGYASDYQEYVDDASAVIDSYTTETGAGYSTDYPDPNTNSTATALMAFSALGDLDKATKYYNMLVDNYEDTTGVFTYYGSADAYATKDAVVALGYYRALLASQNDEEEATTPAEQTTQGAQTTTSAVANSDSKTSPETGAVSGIGIGVAAAGFAVLMATKKKD